MQSNEENIALNGKKPRHMCGAIENQAQIITLEEACALIPKSQRDGLLLEYNVRKLAEVFSDADLMRTAEVFFESDLNVCGAARKLYMHRNTLNYRLRVIAKKTGLDIRDFRMAVTFKILHNCYRLR